MASLFEVDALRQLVQVVDDLRDVGLARIISLPRIVVVGSQSSGKSSVLESVVGLNFLPRGDGVVTRRPLELRLVHLSKHEVDGADSYAVFDQDKTTKYVDFDKVRIQIESLTEEVAGKNKGIVDVPIILTVYSASCPNLTLIDLPGITRVPIKGSDQHEDIETITRNMAAKYIEDSRTIILAVMPANQDMSTSDALQIARKYDPEGVRTIGVLTKLDLMDKGTDAVRMVRGEEIHLHLGYVAVKNRSKQDIMEKKKVLQALAEEKEWFSTHRVYSKLPPDLVGTDALVAKLTKVLFIHIRRFLPDIKRDVYERRQKVTERMSELGDGVPLDMNVRVQMMWSNITAYCDMMTSSIRGKFDPRLLKYVEREVEKREPRCGAQIRAKFNELLVREYEEDITHSLSDDEINKTLRDLEGDALPGFPSPDTFEMLVAPHLQKIGSQCIELLNDIAQQLNSLAHRTALAIFMRFPALADKVFEITSLIIEQERSNTRVVVENIVESQCGYLFTNDETYLTLHGLMRSMDPNKQDQPTTEPKTSPKPEPTTFQKVGSAVQGVGSQMQGFFDTQRKLDVKYSGAFIGEIRKRLDAYFKLCVRNIRDSVPKAVGFNLVRQVQNKLAFTLHQHLANPGDLLSEPPHIAEERKALSAQLVILQNAAAVLSRDVERSLGMDIDADLERKYADLLNKCPPTGSPVALTRPGSGTLTSLSPSPRPPSTASPNIFSSTQAPPAKPANLFGSSTEVKKSNMPFTSTRKNPLFD